MVKTDKNPRGLPMEEFDKIRAAVRRIVRSSWKDLSVLSTVRTVRARKVSQGLRDSFWLQGMMAGFPAAYECIKAFSETDFTEDLKKIDVPTLILHGDDDQIVPIARCGAALRKTGEGRNVEGDSRSTPRDVFDAQGPD